MSSTDIGPNTWRPSGTWQMPERTRWSALARVMSAPPKRMLPPLTGCTPEMARSSVVLPAPLAPTSATSWPLRTSMSMPCSAWMRP